MKLRGVLRPTRQRCRVAASGAAGPGLCRPPQAGAALPDCARGWWGAPRMSRLTDSPASSNGAWPWADSRQPGAFPRPQTSCPLMVINQMLLSHLRPQSCTNEMPFRPHLQSETGEAREPLHNESLHITVLAIDSRTLLILSLEVG